MHMLNAFFRDLVTRVVAILSHKLYVSKYIFAIREKIGIGSKTSEIRYSLWHEFIYNLQSYLINFDE